MGLFFMLIIRSLLRSCNDFQRSFDDILRSCRDFAGSCYAFSRSFI
ncbi:hypothetical protein HMPREF9444_01163 [Succinatimonas hippei YIT 12066]|uniref:Uncharacterized protein n=1 Tax=Succinatimonas hippei (strain DSM 22608 / JCM 16073 / KCTC 15190 / YIT 12066) TaxID=762983 RepID=E8LKC5_SUCHY|nr:hypothetical protein HMPREF9444_01163 [Succinatimonas hippei YIT 12066]